MKFIIETISGRKGIKNFNNLYEYIDFMTNNGNKIKFIKESDLPYNDKPVKLPSVSTSKGWEQIDSSAFGRIGDKAEKGDCLLPSGNKGVFKNNAQFEPSKSSETPDKSESPKVDNSPVKTDNEGEEKDLPKFKYEDSEKSESESSEKSSNKKEEKENDSDDEKKEKKEQVNENNDNGLITIKVYGDILKYKNKEEAFRYFERAMNSCDPESTEYERYEYIVANLENGKTKINADALYDSDEDLNEGFKDSLKKAGKYAKGALAGAAMAGALASNAHGMEDPYYDGATQPFDNGSYEQVVNINGYEYTPAELKKLQKEYNFSDEEMQQIMNGEDPLADGATQPFKESVNDSYDNNIIELYNVISEEMGEDYLSDEEDDGFAIRDTIIDFGREILDNFDEENVDEYYEQLKNMYNEKHKDSWNNEIIETLRLAGIQLNEMDEQANNEEDGEVDEKTGKTKLFEEDPLEESPMSDEDFDNLEDNDKVNWDLSKYRGNFTVKKDDNGMSFMGDNNQGNMFDMDKKKDYVTKYFSKGSKESPSEDSLEYAEDQVEAWENEKFMAEYDDTMSANKRIRKAEENLAYWKNEVKKRQGESELNEADNETLEETKPARYNQHLNKDKSFANISASRSNDEFEKPGMEKEKQKQSESNNKKTAQLKKDIKDLGLSYIKTYGAWRDEGPVTQEDSFLIPNITKEQALELGKKYGQYSVIFKEEGDDNAYMYITLDNEDFGKKDMTFDMSNDSKFSQVKKSKEELEPYSGWTGLKPNGKGYNLSYKVKDED